MKIKLESLWRLARITEAVTARGELPPIEEIQSVRIQAMRSHFLNKQIEAINKEAGALEQSRQKLIQKYGKETVLKNGLPGLEVEPNSDNWKAFWDELTSLLEQEVEIPGERFSLAELGESRLSGNAEKALGFLFTENE